eukprot:COSAG04_NODE_4817_length_1880_cov_8.916625_1_plen_356_part_10
MWPPVPSRPPPPLKPPRALPPPLLLLALPPAGGEQLEALPKGCTFTPLAKTPDGGAAASSCYSDHWCHGGHNWCRAHDGKRTLEHGAPGCSDPASGGEAGSLCDPHKVTPEYCARVCWTFGRYPYSGATQMSGEGLGSACYCGDEPNLGEKTGVVQPSTSCSAPCAGSAAEMCGAPDPSWFVNVGSLQPEGCGGLSAEEDGALSFDIIFIAATAYILGVAVYRQKVLKLRGWQVVPHSDHAQQLYELVLDGLRFTSAKLGGGSGPASATSAPPTERTPLVTDAQLGGGDSARKGGWGSGKRSGKSSKKKSGRQKADRQEPASGNRPDSTAVAAPHVRTMERQLREEKEARDGLHSS